MTLHEMFKTDRKLEKDGVILNFDSIGVQITIARAHSLNKRYMKEIRRYSKKYNLQIKNDLIDPETDNKVMIGIYSRSIVLGWKGVKDPKTNKEIPFSPQACEELFLELHDLFDFIKQEANRAALFKNEELEEEKKS